MKWFDTLKKTGAQAAKSSRFLIIAIVVIAVIYAVAYGLEKVIEVKNGKDKTITKTKKMTVVAMFSAVAFVLMLFEIPLGFVPSFYKIDLSELPILIGSFAMGPAAGVAMEAVKIVLKVFIKGTSTAFVGDFANFVIGCMFVVPAAFIYNLKKTKARAIIGMVVGTVLMCTAGCLLNAYMLIPTYATLFGMPLEVIIGMGTKVNPSIKDLTTFIVLAVMPFNVIKGVIDGILTTLLYKHVRKLI